MKKRYDQCYYIIILIKYNSKPIQKNGRKENGRCMKERWIEEAKKADFEAWAEALSVTPLTARLIRNRGPKTLQEAREYLYGTMDSLADPLLMKDMEKGASLLAEAVKKGEKIAIVSDFDDDGIFSGQILYEGIREIGGMAKLFTPERVREGYGINARIIDEAKRDGFSVILTCDNGIAAVKEVDYAKSLGFTVIVTDHHEMQETLPRADAVLDPKRPDCPYPFKSLCGGGVAFRLIQVLYARFGILKEREEALYEYAAIATVADVVELQGENRVLVREGLRRLRNTNKTGLLALMDLCGIDRSRLNAYHIGFILGPCFNAVGRLSHVSLAFELLETEDTARAYALAEEIRDLNEERKRMTEEGFRKAEELLLTRDLDAEKILFVRLEGVHESVVGIIAGRLKEKYGRPVFVFTDAGELLKGSGRSVPAYHMLRHLLGSADLMDRFGGHAMAAGLSLRPENLEALRERLNRECEFTTEELLPPLRLDARMPLSAVSERQIEELGLLEPFGTGNPQPLFARPHFRVHQLRILGKDRNVVRMVVSDGSGARMDAILFGGGETADLLRFLRAEFGDEETEKAMRGAENGIDLAFAYRPGVNEYMGRRSLQITVSAYCRIR